MKTFNLILTVIYGCVASYTIYMACMHVFIYVANERLGHSESFREAFIFLICAAIFGVVTMVGYKLHAHSQIHFLFKCLFYLPIVAVLLYVLWGILLVLSSGGKWN